MDQHSDFDREPSHFDNGDDGRGSRSPRRSPRGDFGSRSPPRSRSPRGRSPPYRGRSPRGGSRSRSGGSPRRYPPRYRSRSPNFRRRDQDVEPSNVLAIFGLTPDTDEAKLEEEFSKFAPIESVNLIRDKRTGDSKKFAFVHYPTVDEASRVKELATGLIIDGNEIRIDYSATNKPHDPTPGRYMGRRRRGGGYHPYERRGRFRSRSPPYRGPYRSRSPRGPYRSRSPPRGPYRSRSPRGPYRSRSPPRGPYRSRSPPRGPYRSRSPPGRY